MDLQHNCPLLLQHWQACLCCDLISSGWPSGKKCCNFWRSAEKPHLHTFWFSLSMFTEITYWTVKMKVTWSVGPVACLLHSLGGWHTQFYMCLLEVLRPVSYIKCVETLCLKWFFSHSVGYGNWELDGEIASDIKTEGNVTTVQCMSTHLTSFAVLVDVAGGLQVCQYVAAVIMIAYYHHCCCCCSYRKYLNRNTRPYKLYHTLDVPFLLSVLSSLLCSFYCKGERLEQGMVYTHSLEIKCPVIALIYY